MPHVRNKKFEAMHVKIEVMSKLMKDTCHIKEKINLLENQLTDLQKSCEKQLKELDAKIYEEDKKEVRNRANSAVQGLGIAPCEEEVEEHEVKEFQGIRLSEGYKCVFIEQPKLKNGKPDQQKNWSPILGLWIDWRSPLNLKYKTSMCHNFREGGCHMGNRCCYAHHEDELRPNYSINLNKTITDYRKHKTEIELRLKTGWDWEQELIHDKIID